MRVVVGGAGIERPVGAEDGGDVPLGELGRQRLRSGEQTLGMARQDFHFGQQIGDPFPFGKAGAARQHQSCGAGTRAGQETASVFSHLCRPRLHKSR